ncbi:MAG TPA: site-specific DNA-methyltransferase [Anaerolineales bacterium]|nr:site-specific DNA-methyltransferase [Anaerolineales bacterium]
MTKRKRKSTRTSAFGAPGRVSHNSSDFYSGRLYQDQFDPTPVEYIENAIPSETLDHIMEKSAEKMDELADSSIHLMVTSPPYNVRKEYDDDLTLEEYLELLRRVFQETRRVLVPGGRACVNLANLGRKPYLPLHAYVIQLMLGIGFKMRGEIIWDKASSASASTAWGSWMSATNPVLRDTHEYILVFSKDTFARPGEGKESTIRKEDFLDWTKSVWTFPAASARQIGHPAPFPEDLPRRLIELYSFRGDVVLDPFCGSGTTCLAATRAERHFVGYEIDPGYAALARERLEAGQG